jgi:hypothetical protein
MSKQLGNCQKWYFIHFMYTQFLCNSTWAPSCPLSNSCSYGIFIGWCLYNLWTLSIYKHKLVLHRCCFSWNWLISGCLRGWCSENTCAWWHILLCVFHCHLITAETCWGGLCVLENTWKHSLLWWQITRLRSVLLQIMVTPTARIKMS